MWNICFKTIRNKKQSWKLLFSLHAAPTFVKKIASTYIYFFYGPFLIGTIYINQLSYTLLTALLCSAVNYIQKYIHT